MKKEWEKFLEGKWVKHPPKKVGNYPIANRAGDYCGIVHVIKSSKNTLLAILPGAAIEVINKAWLGWWWSEALPEAFPTPNNWDKNNE